MVAFPRLLPLLPLALGLAGCDGNKAAPEQGGNRAQAAQPGELPPASRLDRSHAGTMAPTSSFENPSGEAASLADFGGKPLLVNLWATWCAPCIAEMPTLDALAAREQGKLQVLAISQDMEGKAKVDAFFAERRFTKLEPYIDPELGLMSALKVETLPTTILYNAEGREVWRVVGIEDWRSARAAALIAEAF